MERIGAPAFAALPPLSLYIHIPWCIKKCPYCDFNSHAVKGSGPNEQRYVNALLRDLELALPSFWGRTIHTVFFGGGTPSLFSAQAIDDILCGVRARTKLAADAEITLEANPGTFEIEKFAAFRDAGVNRLSIGVQSFDDEALRALGRVHGGDEAARAVEIGLKTVGNVNIDLMYALPAQTPEAAAADVNKAIAFGVSHLSAYQLTLEPNTLFHLHPPKLPDEGVSEEIEHAVHHALAAAGYARYEISAFAKPERRCAHNLNYWKFGDYVGIGAGAHQKLSMPNAITRAVKAKQPEDYMQRCERDAPTVETRMLSRKDAGFEFMLNALRLVDGFDVAIFAERTGHPISVVSHALDAAEKKGLIARDHLRIHPTSRGLQYLNDLQTLFL